MSGKPDKPHPPQASGPKDDKPPKPKKAKPQRDLYRVLKYRSVR